MKKTIILTIASVLYFSMVASAQTNPKLEGLAEDGRDGGQGRCLHLGKENQ